MHPSQCAATLRAIAINSFVFLSSAITHNKVDNVRRQKPADSCRIARSVLLGQPTHSESRWVALQGKRRKRS